MVSSRWTSTGFKGRWDTVYRRVVPLVALAYMLKKRMDYLRVLTDDEKEWLAAEVMRRRVALAQAMEDAKDPDTLLTALLGLARCSTDDPEVISILKVAVNRTLARVLKALEADHKHRSAAKDLYFYCTRGELVGFAKRSLVDALGHKLHLAALCQCATASRLVVHLLVSSPTVLLGMTLSTAMSAVCGWLAAESVSHRGKIMEVAMSPQDRSLRPILLMFMELARLELTQIFLCAAGEVVLDATQHEAITSLKGELYTRALLMDYKQVVSTDLDLLRRTIGSCGTVCRLLLGLPSKVTTRFSGASTTLWQIYRKSGNSRRRFLGLVLFIFGSVFFKRRVMEYLIYWRLMDTSVVDPRGGPVMLRLWRHLYSPESILQVRAFGRQELEARQFQATIRMMERRNEYDASRQALMHLPMVQLLTSCAHVSEVAAIALVTGSGSGDDAGIVGSVMTAALGQSVGGEAGTWASVSGSIDTLLDTADAVASAADDACRIVKALDTPTEGVPNGKLPSSSLELAGLEVDVRNVSFAYEQAAGSNGQRGNSANSPGLCDISFCVPPGQRVAIVGESGTGKTTLVEVLLQAIKPDKGQVFLSGKPLSSLNPQALRSTGLLGCVMQESPLTERASIREALNYGMTPMASDAELLDALARAQLQYTLGVKSLGLDGKLAELSGGERQRVELARVILTRPRLAILDEATSALDEVTQKRVMKEIFEACGTVILTCHRPSVVRMCERAIVLVRGGSVVEDGLVEELSRDPNSRLRALMAERISPQVQKATTALPLTNGFGLGQDFPG